MKKTFLYSLLTIAVAGFIASNASAAAFDNGETGGEVSIAVTATGTPTAAGPLTFTPSTKVRISGSSSATSFAMASYHTGVLGKKAAQAYGMAADSNKQFVLDIGPAGVTTYIDPLALVGADTNAATAFTGTAWVSI